MSRIGKLPISVPAGVTVALNNGVVTVKGPKGELSQKVDSSIKTIIEDGQVTFEIDENSPVNYKQKQAFHGLYRSLVNNMGGLYKSRRGKMLLVVIEYRFEKLFGVLDAAHTCAYYYSFRCGNMGFAEGFSSGSNTHFHPFSHSSASIGGYIILIRRFLRIKHLIGLGWQKIVE